MKIKDKNILYIIFACLFTYILYLACEYFLTDGMMGVPLDDSWIHFRFAENFANGFFFQFNPGEPTAGTTSPLWVVLLGTIAVFTSNLLAASIVLSAFFHLLSCIFIYRLSLFIFTRENSPFINFRNISVNPEFLSLIAAMLAILAGRFAWSSLSGMETTLFAFLSILGIYVYLKELDEEKFSIIPFFIFGLAAASRPEGFLLFGIFLFNSVIQNFKSKTFNKNLKVFAAGIFIFGMISLPYLIFSYNVSGHFFPNTYRGQGGQLSFIPNINYLGISLQLFLEDNPVTAVLYVSLFFSYFIFIREYFKTFRFVNIIFQWIIFLPLVSSFIAANWRHHNRYLIPLIPLISFAGMFIMTFYISKTKEKFTEKFLLGKRYIIPLFLVFSLFYYIIFGISLGFNTQNINDQQLKIAHWVKQNIPKSDTIALNDIGAITYISKNRVVDMAGLITPEFLRYRTYSWNDNLDSMFYLLKKNNVSYIIIYDHWFKEFLDKYGSSFQFITSAILTNNTICGGEEMKIYKTNFYRKD